MCRREPFLLEIQHSVQRYLDPRYWRYRSKVYVVLTWLTVPICDMRTVESSLIFSGFATVFYTHAISRNLGTIEKVTGRVYRLTSTMLLTLFWSMWKLITKEVGCVLFEEDTTFWSYYFDFTFTPFFNFGAL